MSIVKVGENESVDSAIKRFKRKCQKDGIIGDIRKKEASTCSNSSSVNSSSINLFKTNGLLNQKWAIFFVKINNFRLFW